MALPGGRDEREAKILRQIAFDVGSLEDLKRLKAGLEGDGVTSFRPVNHGDAWAIYFPDPEGKNIECIVRTPWYVDQPRGDKLDFRLSNEEMLAHQAGIRRRRDVPARRGMERGLRGAPSQLGFR